MVTGYADTQALGAVHSLLICVEEWAIALRSKERSKERSKTAKRSKASAAPLTP